MSAWARPSSIGVLIPLPTYETEITDAMIDQMAQQAADEVTKTMRQLQEAERQKELEHQQAIFLAKAKRRVREAYEHDDPWNRQEP